MIDRRFHAVAGMLLLLVATPATAEIVRLGGALHPTSQEVDLKLDPSRPDFSGSVRIALMFDAPTDTFRLHAPTAVITRVVLSDSLGDVPAQVSKPDLNQMITVKGGRTIVHGAGSLLLEFTNVFDTHAVGLYRTNAAGDWYAFTQMEPDDCRLAFPCFDEPGYKIPWSVTLEIPSGLAAVSNSPEASRGEADGWTRVVFRKTPPMPSYLIAIAVGPLEFADIPNAPIPMRVVTARGQSGHVSLTQEVAGGVVKALETWFGHPYPYEKLDLIAAPEFWPGAMENPGAIVFADRNLIQEAATAGPIQRRDLTSIIAHEVAHMWFGDYVTMAWWDDLWLNEAFADWMADKITNQLLPDLGVPMTRLADMQTQMRGDARTSSLAIRRPADSTHDLLGNVGLVYAKGKRTLSMFELWLGADTFQLGINRYLEAHAWGNAKAEDLWNALGEVSGKDVAGTLPGFLDRPGYPLVGVRGLPGGRISVTQSRFTTAGHSPDDALWSIPLGLKVRMPDTLVASSALLRGREEIIQMSKPVAPTWIYPNRNAAGYYRWIIPPERLLELADSAQVRLEPIERAEMAGNITGLFEGGLLTSVTWLDLEGRLAKDPHPLVVAAVVDAIDGMTLMLIGEEEREPFAIWLKQTFRPALDRIGLTPRPGEPVSATLLRPKLIRLLGKRARDPQVIAEARRLTQAWFTDPASVEPSSRNVALEVAAATGDSRLWDACRTRFESTTSPVERRTLLGAMASFQDPGLLKKSLDWSLTPPFRSTEFRPLFDEIGTTEAGREALFSWIRNSYGELAAKISTVHLPFLPVQVSGASDERQKEIEEFFGDPKHQVAGTTRELEKGEAYHEECRTIRDREAAPLGQYLRRLQGDRG